MSKAARRGKIFLDCLRNGRGGPAVVAYSTRARLGAPVAAPLTWEELGPRTASDRYSVRNMVKRLKALPRDPWEGTGSARQGLARPLPKVGLCPPASSVFTFPPLPLVVP